MSKILYIHFTQNRKGKKIKSLHCFYGNPQCVNSLKDENIDYNTLRETKS